MEEADKRQRLEAAKRAMEQLDALSPAEKIDRLKQVGILTEEGELSERYGGPVRAQAPVVASTG